MDQYKIANSEKVIYLEEALKKEIKELKHEIEEFEMSFGNLVRPMSSYSSPVDATYFQNERLMQLKQYLHVENLLPLKNIGSVMRDELNTCLCSDFTEQTTPLFLHQFYLDQIEALVQSKHMHMLRWCRFCEHTGAIEKLHAAYNQRLTEITEEYNDARSRAQRLSSAYHEHVLGQKSATANHSMKCVTKEDLLIYIRWIITNLHVTKKFSSYTKVLHWLPVIHRSSLDHQNIKSSTEFEVGRMSSDAKSAWQSMGSNSESSFLSPSSTSYKKTSLPVGILTVATELAFSGFVSDEMTLSVPTHTLDLPSFRNQLEALAVEYGLPMHNELVTSADEMELFGAVNRKFKTLFNRQVECRTFYDYDNAPDEVRLSGKFLPLPSKSSSYVQHRNFEHHVAHFLPGFEHWGVDSAAHCLKKASNWGGYIKIKPSKDALQVSQMTCLEQKGKIDELLLCQNAFLSVDDYSLVTESLKDHAVGVREPPTLQALSVSSHRNGKLKSASVWNRIYLDLQKAQAAGANGNCAMEGGDNEKNRPRGSKGKEDSYDYMNTMQMLGLDEGDDTSTQDPTIIQGAYLSFLHLRHLKIQDMRRQCLAVLNYFRSVERTMTIYDGGLSLEAVSNNSRKSTPTKNKQPSSKTSGKSGQKASKESIASSASGKKRGIGSHHYLYNTPADFKIDHVKFMEYSDIENHDDFYSCDGDENEPASDSKAIGDAGSEWKSSITASLFPGPTPWSEVPHVQDQRGYYIMYDEAMRDFQRTEHQLLLVASQYIEKDVAHRSVQRRSVAEKAERRHEAAGEVDLASYGHRDVDRFAVIFDMWTCELNFLINKQKLLDTYFEAYQNTFDPDDKKRLAQAMTDIMYQRPRYDFTKEYFIRTYQAECACLRLKNALLTDILKNQLDDCRQYLCRISRPGHCHGMPYYSSTKQEIATNLPKPSLKFVDMLEFHPSLGTVAGRFHEAISSVVLEVQQINKPTYMEEFISTEKQVLERAYQEWHGMQVIGASYSPQVQRNLFSESVVEDPNLVIEILQSALTPLEEDVNSTGGASAPAAPAQQEIVETCLRCLETVILRHRLIEAASETEILSRLYKQAASEMGFEEFHLYLRLVQFEFANRKEKVDQHPSLRASFIPDDISTDRYIPSNLLLAIQEMDENHLPKFSFQNREGIAQFLMKDGTLNIQVALACQVLHKNCLNTAVTVANNCAQWKEVKHADALNGKTESAADGSDNRSNRSASTTLTQGTARSSVASPGLPKRGSPYAAKLKVGFEKQHRSPEAFISVQLEKTGPRDVVVNAFVKKKETAALALKKPGEIEKLKRSFVMDFCIKVSFRMSIHAMRGQIIAYYSNLLATLEQFPTLRNNYFMLGRPNEKKRPQDGISGMTPDSKSLNNRPRKVLSSDGKHFMNLWFIPHYTEVLLAHRNLDYEEQHKILKSWLIVTSSLHDIVLYLCAHARLGRTNDQLYRTYYTTASDWGGVEGVGAELSEIQQQIDALPMKPSEHTKAPNEVAELLAARKKALYNQFYAAVKYSMRETFLASNNFRAFKSVTENMYSAFETLVAPKRPSLSCMHFRVPLPLVPGRLESKMKFPWIGFETSHGIHPSSYPNSWRNVESSIQLCLAGLSDTERHVANGEILGVGLILQEVLAGGTAPLSALEGPADEMPKGFLMLVEIGKSSGSKSESSKSEAANQQSDAAGNKEEKHVSESDGGKELVPLCKLTQPLEAYKLINTYFKLWNQFETMKQEWVKDKLGVEINTPKIYREFNHVFRAEILLPVFTSMARQMGGLDQYSESSSDDQPIKLPSNVSEFTAKARLLVKLLEIFECKMIVDVRNRISKELTQVLAERSREESALPTDVWRHSMGESCVKENFTVNRPHIVEQFVQQLYSDSASENGTISFSKDHLHSCLSKLASLVMQRERENYESYSLFYENLLRHHHHLLYLKELEVKAIASKQGRAVAASGSQCSEFQLADRSHELILEITALRAQIAEMREDKLRLDLDIRDDVRRDYQELVQDLFEACVQMKAKLAQCHLSIHDDMRGLIAETREEAMRSLGKLKNETPSSTAEERLRTITEKNKKIETMQRDQHELNMLLSKLTALNHWKRTSTSGRYKVAVEQLNQEVNRTRRDCLTKQLLAKQETELLHEELTSARNSLKESEERLRKAHEQIEREKRKQKEKEYKELQELRNRNKLEQARQQNMNRLVTELEEKNVRLHSLTADIEKNAQIEQTNQIKIQRSFKHMSAQLSLERNLKLDAFDRVDSLQAQVMGSERDYGGFSTSRATSAVLPRSVSRARVPSASTPRVRVRPMSSVPPHLETPTDMPIKRPQTATGRLKNTIAAALLTELYPPAAEHETVIQLDRQNK